MAARFALSLSVLALLPHAAPAQGEPAPTPPKSERKKAKEDSSKEQKPRDTRKPALDAKDLAQLRKTLADTKLSIAERERALLSFFDAHAQKRFDVADRKKLLVRLATFELALRKARSAIGHFREAEALCKAGDLYVRARCRLGMGQAHELLGDESEALARYREAKRLHGTPFARMAASAIARLRTKRRVTIGKALALPPETKSLRGQRVRAQSSRATLLLCIPPLRGTEAPRLPKILTKGSEELPLRILVSAPSRDARRWAALFAKGGKTLRITVLRDRVDLALGIASLPTSILVDATGTVLELNPSLRRLRELFRERKR